VSRGLCEWHGRYRNNKVDYAAQHTSSAQAIVAACRLIDDGCDIGTGPLNEVDPIGWTGIGVTY